MECWIWLGAFFCGFLSTLVFRKEIYKEHSLLGEEHLKQLLQYEWSKSWYLFYLLRKRGIFFGVIFWLQKDLGQKELEKEPRKEIQKWVLLKLALLIYTGIIFGMFFMEWTVRYGIKGLVAFFVCLFPHIPCYIVGFFCHGISCKNKKKKKIRMLFLIVGLLLIALGFYLETFINPSILQKYLQVLLHD